MTLDKIHERLLEIDTEISKLSIEKKSLRLEARKEKERIAHERREQNKKTEVDNSTSVAEVKKLLEDV